MTSLDIRPHSRRISRLAIVGLCLLAAGSFAVGIVRQLQSTAESSPFPATQASTPQPAAMVQIASSQIASSPPPQAPAPSARHVDAAPPPPADDAGAPSSAAVVDTSQASAEPAPAASPPAPEPAPVPSDPPT
jgi:hypothetical protein